MRFVEASWNTDKFWERQLRFLWLREEKTDNLFVAQILFSLPSIYTVKKLFNINPETPKFKSENSKYNLESKLTNLPV